MTEADKHECVQLDRLGRIESDLRRLYNDIHGNGRGGMREDIVELRTQVSMNTKVVWVVLGVVLANLAGVVYRFIQ